MNERKVFKAIILHYKANEYVVRDSEAVSYLVRAGHVLCSMGGRAEINDVC